MLRLDFSLADLSLPPPEVDEMLAVFAARRGRVEAAVTASHLSPRAKGLYLDKFHDRLKALAQWGVRSKGEAVS